MAMSAKKILRELARPAVFIRIGIAVAAAVAIYMGIDAWIDGRTTIPVDFGDRPVTLLVLVGVIAATGLMYMTSQKELAPQEDQGILFTLVKTPQYANLDYLEASTDQLNQVFSTVPENTLTRSG